MNLHFALLTIVICSMGCTPRGTDDAHIDTRAVVLDRGEQWEDRWSAGATLNEASKAEVSEILISRLTGRYDLAAFDDVGVLGIVGNEEIAVRLEALLADQGVPGKIRASMQNAVNRIRAREMGEAAGDKVQ